jgi:hypothetical protein
MNCRWGFVVRASAICLVLLALSPLTHPFSTLDVATLAGQATTHDSGSLKTKPLTLGWQLTGSSLTGPPELDAAAGRSPIPPTLTDRQQVEQRVLRI